MAQDDRNPALIHAPAGTAAFGASLAGMDGAALLGAAADILLLLDGDDVVRRVRASPQLEADGAAAWIGRPLAALVTVEGRPKIAELVAEARAGLPPRWRQVTHVLAGGEVPIRYACVAGADGQLIAIGRDERAAAAMQQRLLQAQQSLERDYLRLRQAEGRYRLLFDLPDEATLIVEAGSWRIADANAAAHRLLGVAPGTLVRQPAGTIADPAAREALLAHLGAATSGATGPTAATLRTGAAVTLVATPFRQDRATFLLLRFQAPGAGAAAGDAGLRRVVDQMPDAFVLAGRSLAVIAANQAFLDMVQAPAADAVTGVPLATWLGRPGVDLELIVAELRKAGVVRNVATIVRGRDGGQEEVEVSAVLVAGEGEDHLGFVLRGVSRRLRDLPPAERDLPRTVEQLTELVGRLSLKEIVRESTDLIERMCIEAALAHTADNRASAAELLGLSRQGLYTKLHRHGLGGLVQEE